MALTKINSSVIANNTIAVGNIADNSVDATKIASNSILTRHIDDNQIGIDQLNVSDGSSGQALTTNGSGTLSFANAGETNRLPLAGGTLTGALVGTSSTMTEGFLGGSNGGIRIHSGGTKFFNITAANAARDNIMDIGASDARFKDLYLGGGVYLGGTGSANLLNDYEEGTWTPTINDGVIASATGRYTKVGRMVTVTYNYVLTTLGSSGSMLIVGGLPFTSANNAPGSVGRVLCRYFTKNQIVSYVDYNASVITYYNNSSGNFDQVSHGEVEASYDNDFEATGTHTYFI